MDKIEKILRMLSRKEHDAMLLMMDQIKRDYTKIPGVKALVGAKGWFRIRMGQYRILFTVDPATKKAEIKRITRRNEGTYKRLK